jgi:hypothetical protein
MRGILTVKRELHIAECLATAKDLGPELDNDGRVVRTEAQRRASYRRQAARLRTELANLEAVVAKVQP